MTDSQTPRRASHLMDPSKPRVRASAAEVARLERVQRIVLSVLVFTTIIHLSAGLVIGALFIDDSYAAARFGLCALGAVTGVLAIASARAIHRREPLSAWLLLGLVPGIVGALLILS